MGQDKRALLFRGETLLDRGCHLLNSLVANNTLDEFVISGSIGRANVRIVTDQFCGKGPVGGILSVITALNLKPQDLLMAIPIDMPLLDCKHLTRLVESSTQYQQSVCYHNAWLPISVVITPELLLATSNWHNEKKGLSVAQLLKLSNGRTLEPEQPALLLNVNSPEQWLRLFTY